MPKYPFNTNVERTAASDVVSIKTDLKSVVKRALGSPVVADDDWFVASGNMKVGTYTLLHTAPDVGARNIIVTQTAAGAEDTNGTITVTGTDLSGAVITEVITPNDGAVVAGLKAFATVSSIVGAGWVIGEGNDQIKVGFGEVLGLPDKLADTAQVLAASLAAVREGTHPTVTVSASVLSTNTVDLNSACNGTAVIVYYLV